MAEILPFKGIRYNLDKVGDPALVVSPPYDVISREEQENYYNLHPYNVIRLVFGKDLPGDTEEENKYTRAARYFQEWMNQHILMQDEQPAIYLYRQDYRLSYEEKMKSLLGFIALVHIDGTKNNTIYPHEHTMPATVADRLNVVKACKADLSPLFALYSDTENQIREILISEMQTPPLLSLKDLEGVQHQVWKIQDPEKIKAIQSKIKNKALIIADGHHRYEAAKLFRDYMWALDPHPSKFKPYNYVMMQLVAMEDEGLTIFPIHRLVRGINDFKEDLFLQQLEQFFHIDTFKLDEKEKTAKVSVILNQLRTDPEPRHRFLVYSGQNKVYRLTLKDLKAYEQIADLTLPEVLRNLDVSILQTLILDYMLKGKEKPLEVSYTREEGKAMELVDSGQYQIAFLLSPTRVSQVVEVATLRRRMPPKSTYFYPKPLTGIVMNKIS
jgi:uncharacterized protein (DUF1015 family)